MSDDIMITTGQAAGVRTSGQAVGEWHDVSLYGTQPGDFSEAEPDIELQREVDSVRYQRDAALARAEAAEKERDVLRDAVWHMLTTTDDTQPQTDVDKVIDQLDRRIIGAPERTKLRGALDRADAPDKSRNGQDAAVGRALRLGG